MTDLHHRSITDRLLPAVMAAGRLQCALFASGCAVDRKADFSPVTRADVESEAILALAIAAALPGLTIVAEEAQAAGGSGVSPGDPFVLVDPLDGTRQFVDGLPEFTINIAVVAGGVPVYGLVFAPMLGDLAVTDGPGRAVRARLDLTRHDQEFAGGLAALCPAAIAVRPVPAAGLTVAHSRSRDWAALDAFLAELSVAERRHMGSSYKFCLVAWGEADMYPQLGLTSEWDTAAGEAILRAAGGTVATFDGAPLCYGRHDEAYRNPPFMATGAPLGRLPPRALPAHQPPALV